MWGQLRKSACLFRRVENEMDQPEGHFFKNSLAGASGQVLVSDPGVWKAKGKILKKKKLSLTNSKSPSMKHFWKACDIGGDSGCWILLWFCCCCWFCCCWFCWFWFCCWAGCSDCCCCCCSCCCRSFSFCFCWFFLLFSTSCFSKCSMKAGRYLGFFREPVSCPGIIITIIIITIIIITIIIITIIIITMIITIIIITLKIIIIIITKIIIIIK